MYKVAILDDNPAVVRSIAETVDWQGLSCQVCFTCGNGADGCRLLLTHRPHIVVTDIMMPGLTGLEMKKAVDAFLPHTQFIVLTGYGCSEYARQAVRLRVFDYIPKPVSNRELEKVVAEAIAAAEGKTNAAQPENPVESTLAQVRGRRAQCSGLTLAALDYIHSHIDVEITLHTTAQTLLITSSYLSTLFKKETGVSFVRYVTMVKLDRACHLLADPRNKVYEVAGMVGYQDYGYFYQVFRKYYGCAPGDWPKHAAT